MAREKSVRLESTTVKALTMDGLNQLELADLIVEAKVGILSDKNRCQLRRRNDFANHHVAYV